MVDWKIRRVRIAPSPWPSHASDEVLVRQAGSGKPILFLHGGWGYRVYPVDEIARDLLPAGFRLIVPDRVGYGQSSALEAQPLDFHQRAATESLLLLHELGALRPILWGHSDGAVIAAWMALGAPERFPGLILEAMHFWQNKPGSTPFFQSVGNGSADLGAHAQEALQNDHGSRWKYVVEMNARAWVGLARSGKPREDLFGGALAANRAPTLLLHGRHDPRTEPGELAAAQQAIPGAELALVEGKHAPHAEPRAWAQARERVLTFLERVTARAGT